MIPFCRIAIFLPNKYYVSAVKINPLQYLINTLFHLLIKQKNQNNQFKFTARIVAQIQADVKHFSHEKTIFNKILFFQASGVFSFQRKKKFSQPVIIYGLFVSDLTVFLRFSLYKVNKKIFFIDILFQ